MKADVITMPNGEPQAVCLENGTVIWWSAHGGRWKTYPPGKKVDPGELRVARMISPDVVVEIEKFQAKLPPNDGDVPPNTTPEQPRGKGKGK